MDIYRYAFSLLKDHDEASDAVQETFIRCVEKEDSFKGHCSQKTWLLVIARNYCYNRLKSAAYANKRIDEDFEIESDELNLELKLTFKAAIEKLSDEYRELIFLVDYAGYKYLEIAELTGYSIENVKIKIFRARQELRRLCSER